MVLAWLACAAFRSFIVSHAAKRIVRRNKFILVFFINILPFYSASQPFMFMSSGTRLTSYTPITCSRRMAYTHLTLSWWSMGISLSTKRTQGALVVIIFGRASPAWVARASSFLVIIDGHGSWRRRRRWLWYIWSCAYQAAAKCWSPSIALILSFRRHWFHPSIVRLVASLWMQPRKHI